MIALIAGPKKPPRFIQGLGLPYLAAVLEKAGFKAGIFDLYPSPPDTDESPDLDQLLADAIAGEQPDIVGMTIHTAAFTPRVRLAGLLRERLPKALLVAGGHHPSAEPEHLLRNSDFDVCVIGEGEEVLLEIANRFAAGAGKGTGDWLGGIPGVVYKWEDQVLRTQPCLPVDDLDSLPFPAHHLLGLEDYTAYPSLGIRSTGILTYRGCPMRCAFCLNPQGRRIRQRSPLQVVEEMAKLVKGFRIRGFSIHDNLFGLNRKHTLALCKEIIKRRPDVFWDCWTAGDLVDAGMARRMKAAGCVAAGFGAESGDDQVLLKSQRGFTTAQNRAGIDALRGAGLRVAAFFMIGLPEESEDSVKRTIDFAARCGADTIHFSVYRPWPGTDIWNDPDAFGVRITHGEDFEAYIETQGLSRTAILESAHQAIEELKHAGFVKVGTLRCDQYEWE